MIEKILNKKIVISGIGIVVFFVLMFFLDYLQSGIVTTISKIGLVLTILAGSVFLIYDLKKYKKINYRKIIVLVIIIGVLLRLLYISYTGVRERQHDVEGKSGHLRYIGIIFQREHLPKSNEYQFYQQPLHHLIASVWMKVVHSAGVGIEATEEGIQTLTAIYSSMIILITYCILKELKIKDVYKLMVLMVIAIHPTFIILAGSVNNDILMIMFTFLAILYLIKWNKKPNYKNTIILALVTALIALSKIAGTIIAIPIAYVFINRFVKDICKDEKKSKTIGHYILKFGIFGIISLGLGLSYSIRNIVLFDQSIFYVPAPGEILYCGDKSWFERLTIFSKELWVDTYCHPFEDYNIPAFIIKCSLFGEYHLDNIINNHTIPRLLIIVNCLLIITSIVSLITIICKRKKTYKRLNVYSKIFILIFIAEMFKYFYGNITMPYGCTMDFRYIVTTILTGMMFIIINLMSSTKSKKHLLKHKMIYGLVIAFVILSIVYEVFYMKMSTL